MLNVKYNPFMLSVVMQSIAMLSVIIMNVIMLSVVAPYLDLPTKLDFTITLYFFI
jgi:hypothetical protein